MSDVYGKYAMRGQATLVVCSPKQRAEYLVTALNLDPKEYAVISEGSALMGHRFDKIIYFLIESTSPRMREYQSEFVEHLKCKLSAGNVNNLFIV